MPDRNKKFHELALKSVLFKGRSSLYFCYLKSEKIAHVLAMLDVRSALSETKSSGELVHLSAALPQTIAHFAAGEVDLAAVLAEIFSLLSTIHLAATRAILSKENASIICAEYEQLAQKLSEGMQLSPFVSSDDFSVPALPMEEALPLPSPAFKELGAALRPLKDSKGQKSDKGQNPAAQERVSLILDLVRKNKSLSIKDISRVIKGCSEKTIQRELAALISQGLVRKEGERRWSVYMPT
ncbi:MAG: hypothetical protein KGH79_03525 [Patescibacteria group bacterium]|nr:hypothetical protein [Patescibacteria group bacterium]